jgi:hypothetical protein
MILSTDFSHQTHLLSFTTPGKDIYFLGMHIATTDSHFIPPAVGALMLVGGIVLLCVRPKSV